MTVEVGLFRSLSVGNDVVRRTVFRIEQMPASGATSRRHAADNHGAESQPHPAPAERRGDRHESAHVELAHVHAIIGNHRREIEALIRNGSDRWVVRAGAQLGAAIEGMDRATHDILKAAEQIDEDAKTLAAALKDSAQRGLVDDIQERITGIYEACNFQDLAGQRIGKVMTMLATLEQQVNDMLSRCDGAALAGTTKAKSALLNGPKLDGASGHATQKDIDSLFG